MWMAPTDCVYACYLRRRCCFPRSGVVHQPLPVGNSIRPATIADQGYKSTRLGEGVVVYVVAGRGSDGWHQGWERSRQMMLWRDKRTSGEERKRRLCHVSCWSCALWGGDKGCVLCMCSERRGVAFPFWGRLFICLEQISLFSFLPCELRGVVIMPREKCQIF